MRFSPVSNLAPQRLAPLAISLLLLGLSLGCDEAPSIVQHKVHKSRSGLEALRETKRPAMPPQQTPVTAATKNRMVVAVFDNPDKTWFFKVIGPVEQVNASEEQCRAFFDSVKFEDGQPQWDAPEQWSTGGPRKMRFATLLISGSDEESKPLELAVSSLGPNQNMLLNVNRWRGQLGLGKFTEDQLGTQFKEKASFCWRWIKIRSGPLCRREQARDSPGSSQLGFEVFRSRWLVGGKNVFNGSGSIL